MHSFWGSILVSWNDEWMARKRKYWKLILMFVLWFYRDRKQILFFSKHSTPISICSPWNHYMISPRCFSGWKFFRKILENADAHPALVRLIVIIIITVKSTVAGIFFSPQNVLLWRKLKLFFLLLILVRFIQIFSR